MAGKAKGKAGAKAEKGAEDASSMGKAEAKAAEGRAAGKPGKAGAKAAAKAAENEEKRAAEKMPAKGEKAEIRGEEKAGKAMKGAHKQRPEWVEYKPEELGEAIINMANAGHTAAEIGMMLRDQYGVPSFKKLSGKTIEDLLAEHNLLPEVPRDLLNLIRKSVNLQKHMAENRKDFTAKRGYQLTVSKIRRLVGYYHKKGKLPSGWRYTPETAALLVK